MKVNSAHEHSDVPRLFARMCACVGVVGTQGVADEGEISITDSQTDGIDVAIIFPSDPLIILRDCSFLTSLYPSYKKSRTSKLIFNVGIEDVELRIQFFNREFVYIVCINVRNNVKINKKITQYFYNIKKLKNELLTIVYII